VLGLPNLAWISSRLHVLPQISNDVSLNVPIKFGELSLGRLGNLNEPGQAAAPILRG
jgi:hypothetical protein